MKLIIGLGNPGKKYERTWHNLGWLTLDALAEFCETPKFKKSAKFQAEVTEITINGEKITSNNLMSAIIQKYNPGDKITLHILRDGKEQDVSVTLGSRSS